MRLIDADALMVSAKKRCEGCDNRKGTYCRACDIMDMLDLIEDQPTVELPRWIPVTERLPEEHGGVYACLLKFPNAKDSFPYVLTWYSCYIDGPHFSDEDGYGLKATHWMPLPEPPMEDGHETD